MSGATAETLGEQDTRPAPLQGRLAVLANEPAGAYRRLVLRAPGMAERALPGQFVAFAVGDDPTAMLLRRAVSLHWARPVDERFDGAPTLEVVVAAHGPGTQWLTRRRPGDDVDVVGPLGAPFPQPAGRGAVLVGGGYGSAPLLWLAERLGGDVDLVLGAASADRLFGPSATAPLGDGTVHVTTDDGSAGTPGRVTAVLPDLLAGRARTVYACGPMAMLKAVHDVARAAGSPAFLTVEESMACGIGICMTCVLPVTGPDGITRMTRSCIEGPTFPGDAIRWDAVTFGPGGATSAVPADCLGAPTGRGH